MSSLIIKDMTLMMAPFTFILQSITKKKVKKNFKWFYLFLFIRNGSANVERQWQVCFMQRVFALFLVVWVFSSFTILVLLWHYFCQDISYRGRGESTKWHYGKEPVIIGENLLNQRITENRLLIHLSKGECPGFSSEKKEIGHKYWVKKVYVSSIAF